MEMVEIDPKLFVTCRLCLDNLGVYQIVPSVQQQIKFCYDIEVDPFDGLPQLICKHCESTLSKYAEIKNTYVDKQRTLREKLEGKIMKSLGADIQPEQETVSSTQQLASEKDDKKGRNEFIFDSTSSDKSDSDTSEKMKVKNKKAYKRIKKPLPDVWEINYDKWFICRFCDRRYKTRPGMIRHLNTHPSLLTKYQTCIKGHCSVKLNKVDDKPNISGSERIVVHSWSKFVNSEDRFFYILFTPKQLLDNSDARNSKLQSLNVEKSFFTSESSDSEPILKRTKKKRRRLLSRSSSETVVVEKNKNQDAAKLDTESTSEATITQNSNASELNENECINIDDSSDSASNKSSNSTKIVTNADSLMILKDADCKTIQNIIAVCYKKYLKRLDSCEREIPCHILHKPIEKVDSSLKHKVLSFGRKVINNPGFSCIGLLRYLEHHNLEIVWIPRLFTHTSKKSDYIRIMTKLRNREERDPHDFGWENLQNVDPDVCNSENKNAASIDEQVVSENLAESNSATVNNNTVITKDGKSNSVCKENKVAELLEDQAILYTNTANEKDILLKKLLNSNPVANPKQLPKKLPTNLDRKKSYSKKKKNNLENYRNESILADTENAENSDVILHMPVITSTVSLAPAVTNVKERENNGTGSNNGNVVLETQSASSFSLPELCSNTKNNNVVLEPQKATTSRLSEECSNTNNKESEDINNTANSGAQQGSVKNLPWLKVKPVSELMTDKALNSMNQHHEQQNNVSLNQNVVIPFPFTANVALMTKVPTPRLNNSSCQDSPNQAIQLTPLAPTIEQSMSASSGKNYRDYVLMDSVDLPYKRTDSPFRYFQNLLHIHNIILLESSETMTLDFVCILKFKLVFQQETNLPVVLCLALFNSRRQFCIKVKDVNQKDIDISRLSANWQWEILKVYTGDVVTKLLQNAQKINKEVHDYTQIFLCLLKSIKFQKLT